MGGRLAARWRVVALASTAALAVIGLCVPLPGAAIDALHLAHVAASSLLVAYAFRASDARSLSSLPSSIALASVLRLSLEVAFSRAALAGHATGLVTASLAGVIARDGALPALAAFALLAVAQLVLVARGAERAAEVSARFALDAMPGAQLAIDADLRAGAIDAVTARRARESVESEARLHGALDGALRFIKGDAIVGLVAASVNLLGVALADALRHGASVRDAFEHAGSLAAAQGVAARVPALAVATAAAMVVTRPTRRGEGSTTASAPLSLTVSHATEAHGIERACREELDSLGVAVDVAVARGDRASLSTHGVSRESSTAEDVTSWARASVRRHAWRLVGIEEARAYVEGVAREAPSLARAAIATAADVTLLADALALLLREGVSLRPAREVLEAFAREAARERDAIRLTEALRARLTARITAAYAPDGALRALRLHPVIEDTLRDHAARRPWQRPSADLADDIARAVRSAMGDAATAVIVTDASVRWYARAAIEAATPDVAVLATQELSPDVRVETRAVIAPE